MESSEDSHHQEYFPFLARLEVLPAWEEAARLFLEQDGTVMVLGAPDTGKSTLSRYLIYRAFAAGERVALVDLDLGQSHLGPPATLGLGLFPPRRPGDDSLSPEGWYFIGQTSPVGAILEVVVGCRFLVDQAARQGVGRVVVNSSGLVHGPAALRLKRAQLELLNPTLIFALEQGQELEPLLLALGVAKASWLLRLPVSSRLFRRTPEERRRYREERFRRYFQGARRLTLPWRSLVWEGLTWGQGEPLKATALEHFGRQLGSPVLYGEFDGRRTVLLLAEPPPGPLDLDPEEMVHWLSWSGMHFRLVGLLDASHRTLALGLILPGPWDPEVLALWTPLPPDAASRVCFLKAGKMKVTLEGRELAQG